MPAVASGEAAAGVVIHEGRFTYPRYGLRKILDLGQWWEDTTAMPIPLGVIAARRDLGPEFAAWMEDRIRASLELARAQESRVWPIIREHAQELDEATLRSHIETFVTDCSWDMGEEGEKSLLRLLG
jgi:1,4-dihydroxy-6-naphthoate synthase